MVAQEDRQPIVLENQGQKIFGVIHRPLGVAKSPAVLMCHGLGGHKVGKARLYVDLAAELAKNGITALRVDFRGSGDSEGDFSSMTVDGEISDAMVALEFLKSDPYVDDKRIAIFGRSFGGAIAIIAASLFGNIKSMALWAPFFSSQQWQSAWEKAHMKNLDRDERDHLVDIEGLQPGYEFLKQLFSLSLDDKLRALENVPLFHVHGEKDWIIDLTHADSFKKIREDASAESVFRLLPESDHHFFHHGERKEAIVETVNWFVKTLAAAKE